jgi:GNAT superfamily N-acetyltransferase
MPSYFDRLPHYELLKLDTPDYPRRLELPPGYRYVDEVPDGVEAALLEPTFPGWRHPVEGRLPGMRPDSRVAVAHGDEVVAVCYVTEANQLGLVGYGELHYAAVRDDHRGGGLWRAMITELFARATTWGVVGVIFVTDRAGPIEMYLRLGAQRIGIRPKPRHRPLWRRAASRVKRALT